ncbi:uncharacterized protein RAG0_00907 [Rhynchosporium agropyri]|uniref:Uncharacterized protein n=1 Tax=Rhynchosporium agropyri TaxID=914238 RepID=A0A1E1JV29_9HELO|nr:uncharacterized protein RAG0_00907 [Rhynchosporium agropyri]
MEEFVELGLEGADKMIDKHFHKLPDKALHSDTYNPKNLHLHRGQKSRKNSTDTRSNYESDSEKEIDHRSTSHRGSSEYRNLPATEPGYSYIPPDSVYSSPPYYSHDPPHPRPEYMPSPPPASATSYYTPQPSAGVPHMAMNRGRDVDCYNDDDYHSDSYRRPRRPKAVTRRSSSYHCPRDRRNDYSYDQQISRSRRHGNGSGSDTVDRVSDKAKDVAHRYKLKEDMNNVFTASTVGLTGGAVGAMVGGWAAQKAQVGYRKKGPKIDPNSILTLLGATVGGLAVNAVVDKWQDGATMIVMVEEVEEATEVIIEAGKTVTIDNCPLFEIVLPGE